jgi:hypothetical protein
MNNMSTPLPENEDARLRVLFSVAAEPIADEGFSAEVMARVAERSRRRAMILGTASVIGSVAVLAVAALPAFDIVRALGLELAARSTQWPAYIDLLQSPLAVAGAAFAAAAPGVLRWLED